MMSSNKLRKAIAKFIFILICAVFISPFYVSIVYSLKTKQQITFTGLLPPTQLHFQNYINAVSDSSFFIALKNSFFTTIPTVTIILIICPMASYIFARYKSKTLSVIYSAFLAALLIPYQSILLPVYSNLKSLDLLNTYTGNVLVKVGFQISISILICTGFVKSISREMEEAAYIDGLNRNGAFWRIIFPLLTPVLISMLIINALFAWNDFQLSTVTLLREEVQTLPQMLFRYFGVHTVELNEAFAAFALSMLPLILLYLFTQKYITNGVMAGSVKG